MTITSEMRPKVVQMYSEGKGRNEIARLLNRQISEGSVGNILRAYRAEAEHGNQQEQPLQQSSPLQEPSGNNVDTNTSSPSSSSDADEVKSPTL
jgi:hypothetical protein